MANEKRLVDADVFIRDLTAMKSVYDAIALDGMIKALNEAPTVDAMEVVRCRDCKHCDPENLRCDHPMGTNLPLHRKPDDFCSYGERRRNNHEKTD